MPQSFAINGNVAEAQRLAETVQPRYQTVLQSQRFQTVEDTPERVVRRNAVGQRQEPLEPGLAVPGEGGDILPRVRTSDDRTNGHRDDVPEQMTLTAVDPWIFEAADILTKSERGRRHDSPP
jgi:hypothetical protein